MKRFVKAVFILTAMVSVFAGCAKEKSDNTFVLGLDTSFPPMGFIDENNEIAGFDIDVAKEVFPNAKRIVDKYHWIRQGIWAFESVRKQVQKNLKKKDRIRMKRSRYLLNKMHDYLSSSEKQSVEEMLTVSERLKAAYELKEAFFQILRAKNHRAALDSWVQKALSEGEHIFQECAATLLQWKEEILLSMRVSITNGFAEGCNNKIKVLKRNAYGYRNFARFRNRILHMFAKK